MNKRLLMFLTAVIVLSAGIIAAMPVFRNTESAGKVETDAPAASETVSAAELVILEDLGSVFHRMDSIKAFEVSGSVSVLDPAESIGTIRQIYRYAKLDSLVYYKLGDQEILSNTEMQLIVDHKAEKIFVSRSQQAIPNPFPSPSAISAFLTGEGYSIKQKKLNGLRWISLERPNHITCKEYRIGIDHEGFIRQSYCRLTDQSDPLNNEKDRILEASADQWMLGEPALSIFSSSRFVVRTAEGYKPVSEYKDYDLIVIQ
ncbi:hypothetical protein WJU16_00825 [Chitinophaga pollutisoli]|uniref:Uncharacterized protein n=1 Tax=Chitinophaga pollutisoli TaxID=3133966 RepID=A0ABZ2YPB6_9BACT